MNNRYFLPHYDTDFDPDNPDADTIYRPSASPEVREDIRNAKKRLTRKANKQFKRERANEN